MRLHSGLIALSIGVLVSLASCGGGGGDSTSGGGGGGGGGGTTTPVTINGVVNLGADTPGIKVRLLSSGTQIATADVDGVTGRFSFAGVPPGTYDVAPLYADWIFLPASRSATATQAQSDVAAFDVAPETGGNTSEELDAQDASLVANPPPEWVEPLAAGREFALAVDPAPGVDRRKWIIDTMLSRARNFYGCGHESPACTTWQLPAGANSTEEPAQTVLSYLWGSRNYSRRNSPSSGSTCTKKLVGLDCSGLMTNLATDAQMGLSGGLTSWFQGDPKNWTIPETWDVRLVKLDVGAGFAYQRGDIVVWPSGAAHIGISTQDGTNPYVFSSTGGQTAACEKNIRSGPRRVQVSFIKTVQPVHVLRFTADPVFALTPTTSWRTPFFSYDTYTGTLVTVPLTSLNEGKAVPAGSSLELTSMGQWSFTAGQAPVTGASGRLLAGGSVVLPAAGSTAPSGGVPSDCQSGPDPYPNDFILPNGLAQKIVLPPGATTLQLSVDDCVMFDNSPVSSDPIRVKVKLVLPAPSARQ
jgi:hypothetical protein